MEWPGALTLYGACVGTLAALAAGWSIWAIVRDRGYLKLELWLKRVAVNSHGEEIEKPVDRLEGIQLHLRVLNTGRRPITVTAWRGVSRYARASDVVIPFHEVMCRKLLNETEQFSVGSRDFVEAITSGLRRMYVIDSSGRRWKVPRKRLRAIEKRIKALHSADGEVDEEAKP